MSKIVSNPEDQGVCRHVTRGEKGEQQGPGVRMKDESHHEHLGCSLSMWDPRVLKPEGASAWCPRWRE